MRIVGLVIFCCFTGVFVYGQSTIKIDYQAADQPLEQILSEVERLYGLNFNYSKEALFPYRASIEARELSLQQFAFELLSPLYLDYEIVEDQYVIIKNKASFVVQIRDQTTNEALPHATIAQHDLSKGAATDLGGFCRFVLKDAYFEDLNISFVGYESLSVSLDSVARRDTLVFYLQPSTTLLGTVVVQEYLNRGIVMDSKASSVSIIPQDMEILPGLSEPDILLSTQMLPGINSNDESASGINVRGSPRDQTLYYWNHIPVYNPAHYFGNISSFIPSTIGKVTIYKNHLPVEYGAAAAGLVMTESVKEEEDLSAEMNLNLTHVDAYLQTQLPANTGQLMLAARRSYNDLILTPTYTSITEKVFEGSSTALYQDQLTDSTFDYNSQVTFYDLNAVWSLERDKDDFQLSWMRSSSILDFDTEGDDGLGRTTQRNDLSNGGFSADWKHLWTDKWSTDLSAAWSRYDLSYLSNTIDYFNDINRLESRENQLSNMEVRLNNDLRFHEKLDAKVGVQYNDYATRVLFYSVDSYPDFEEEYEEEIEGSSQIFAGYVDVNLRPLEKLEVGVGLRQSYFELANQSYLSPQARLTYGPMPGLTLKASAGIYQQFVSALPEEDLNLTNSSEQLWLLAKSSPGMEVITNRQVTAGFIWDAKGWTVDFDLYQKYLEDIHARRIVQTSERDLVGNERIAGLDLMVRKQLAKFNLWASYGYQHSQAEVPDLGLYDIPSRSEIAHQGQLAGSYQLGAFSFSLGYLFKSGLPYTPAYGTEMVYYDEGSFPTPAYEPVHSARLPAYHRVDLSAWYHLPQKPENRISGEIGVSLINLFDKKNVYARTYSADYEGEEADSEVVLYEKDKAIYGFTPNLSIRLRL